MRPGDTRDRARRRANRHTAAAEVSAERQLTLTEINAVLYHESKRRGYCLCAVPMRTVVDARGFDCSLCGEKVTDKSYGDRAKFARGDALKAAYPWITENGQEANRPT